MKKKTIHRCSFFFYIRFLYNIFSLKNLLIVILIMKLEIIQTIFYHVSINTKLLNVFFKNPVFLLLNNQIFRFIIQDFS